MRTLRHRRARVFLLSLAVPAFVVGYAPTNRPDVAFLVLVLAINLLGLVSEAYEWLWLRVAAHQVRANRRGHR